jgi:hypothetical protein
VLGFWIAAVSAVSATTRWEAASSILVPSSREGCVGVVFGGAVGP